MAHGRFFFLWFLPSVHYFTFWEAVRNCEHITNKHSCELRLWGHIKTVHGAPAVTVARRGKGGSRCAWYAQIPSEPRLFHINAPGDPLRFTLSSLKHLIQSWLMGQNYTGQPITLHFIRWMHRQYGTTVGLQMPICFLHHALNIAGSQDGDQFITQHHLSQQGQFQST